MGLTHPKCPLAAFGSIWMDLPIETLMTVELGTKRPFEKEEQDPST
jgi:hypothetical protein